MTQWIRIGVVLGEWSSKEGLIVHITEDGSSIEIYFDQV